jgi:hypothetical protein
LAAVFTGEGVSGSVGGGIKEFGSLAGGFCPGEPIPESEGGARGSVGAAALVPTSVALVEASAGALVPATGACNAALESPADDAPASGVGCTEGEGVSGEKSEGVAFVAAASCAASNPGRNKPAMAERRTVCFMK